MENEWQDKATAEAVASARKIALGNGPLMNTPVGRLKDSEWGWIITAALFGWVKIRVWQAIEEGKDQEQAVRDIGTTPSPGDIAVVHSILGELADTAGIDWNMPLNQWSQDVMTNFLMKTWRLLEQAQHARDNGPGGILQKPKELDEKAGDQIPF
jgi:hypothetical protein